MNKTLFIEELDNKLTKLNIKDKEGIVSYYEELINDQIEAGKDEEEIIKKLGNVSDIVLQALINNDDLSEKSQSIKKVANKIKDTSKTMPKWLFYTLIATAIIWIPLLLAFGISIFSAAIGIIAVAVVMVILMLVIPVVLTASFAFGGSIIIIVGVIHLLRANVDVGIFNIGAGVAMLGMMFILLPLTKSFIRNTVAIIKKTSNKLYLKYRIWKAKKGEKINEN